MLSKMAKPKETTIIEVYNEILRKDLSKSKLPELKQYAKDLKLKVAGNKSDLNARIQQYIIQTQNAIKIQRNARKYIVKRWFKMKGTFKNCVNDCDFYTLEPLNEIPYLYYIQHRPSSSHLGHSYGFNIKSLCTLAVKTNNKFENPYNRENMKLEFESKITSVIKLTNVIFPGNELMKDIVVLNDENSSSAFLSSIFARERRPRNTQEHAFLHRLDNLQQLSIEQRITELFIDIDNLGNYTNTLWLTNLTGQKLYYLIIKINQLWHALPRDLRLRICPYMSPFSEAVFGTMHIDANSPVNEMLRIVVRMSEVLVYSGIDNEHKNLGAMYLLSGITIVSLDARVQLPWLYDNYFTIV